MPIRSKSNLSGNNKSSQLIVEQLEERQMLSTVTIYAQGTTGQEQMTLLIDDVEVATWSDVAGNPFNGGVSRFEYDAGGDVTADQIKVRFDNDLYDPANGIDRNLRVDRIQIDLDTYQTETSNVFSTGTWLPQDAITPGFGRGETLHANGYFQFGGTTGNGSVIEINASADDGPANFNLLIDGNVVDSFQASNSGSAFVYQSDQTVTADRVRIAFTNDLYDPANGIDVNLTVEEIVIDGDVYRTDSSSVFSTGTWLPSDGVAPGFGRGDTLHANGYFEYASTTDTQRFERLDEIGGATTLIQRDAFSGKYAVITGASLSQGGIEMFNADGTNVSGFGNDGFVNLEALTGLDLNNDFTVNDLAFFPDGSLMISGRNFNFGGTSIPYLLKITPQGAIDSNFAVNGFLSGTNLGIASNDSGGSFEVAVDGAGRVAVVGTVWNSRNELHVRYFDSNGNLDTSRGYGGNLTLYPSYVDTDFKGTYMLSDGAFLIAYTGDSGTDFDPTNVVKVGTNGRVDRSYGNNGEASVTSVAQFFTFNDFEVDNNDRMVMIGPKEVVRLTASGQMDESFGTFGRFGYADDFTVQSAGQRFDFDRYSGGAIDSQNRIVLLAQNITSTGRFSFNYDESTLIRITENGNWDASLNGIGIQTIEYTVNNASFGRGDQLVFDQNDNLLVTLGPTGPNSEVDPATWRLSRVRTV